MKMSIMRGPTVAPCKASFIDDKSGLKWDKYHPITLLVFYKGAILNYTRKSISLILELVYETALQC
jgi:hypothetical protein